MTHEWQPIGTTPFEGNFDGKKTAPWDENYVLVCVNEKVGAAFYVNYVHEERKMRGVFKPIGWRWLHECGDCTYGKEIFPTHWMPYPPPVAAPIDPNKWAFDHGLEST